MITLNDLKEIENLRIELKYLEEKTAKIPIEIVKDSVAGSSRSFPYTKHTIKIEGFENKRNKHKYIKQLERQKYQLEKKLNNLEYEVKKIDNSEVRLLIRYKYQDNLNYIQIAHKMNEANDYKGKIYTADSVRMILKRFFEKK